MALRKYINLIETQVPCEVRMIPPCKIGSLHDSCPTHRSSPSCHPPFLFWLRYPLGCFVFNGLWPQFSRHWVKRQLCCLFYLVFFFFATVCEILVPQPGIESSHLAVKAQFRVFLPSWFQGRFTYIVPNGYFPPLPSSLVCMSFSFFWHSGSLW